MDAYDRVLATQHETEQKLDQAHRQQLERLRYEAALAQRQFNRVDPDNRLVAAELEKRWEAALSALKQAEETYVQEQQRGQSLPLLPPALKAVHV